MQHTTTLRAADLSELCMEMHLIVRAGIPFQEGVALLLEEEQNKIKKAFLELLYQHLENGSSFSAAFRKTGAMPQYAVEMIAIGEQTGHLEQVFYALSGYYDRAEHLRQSVRNIIWYPMILLAMMLFVLLMLLVKVMPIFAELFAQLGAELSFTAQMLLQTGQLIGQYGAIFVLCIAVVAAVLYIMSKTAGGACRLQRLFDAMTARWHVRETLTASRLADALVLTLSSGMPVDEALGAAGQLVEDSAVQEKVTACRNAMLLEGASLANAVQEQKLFAPMYCRMIAVGFRTGDMDTIMAEVARRIADDADEALSRLLNRIEPAMVIVLSLMVGLILLSVMLPLVSMMTAIG